MLDAQADRLKVGEDDTRQAERILTRLPGNAHGFFPAGRLMSQVSGIKQPRSTKDEGLAVWSRWAKHGGFHGRVSESAAIYLWAFRLAALTLIANSPERGKKKRVWYAAHEPFPQRIILLELGLENQTAVVRR